MFAMGSCAIVGVIFAILLGNIWCDHVPTPIVMWHGMGDSCCFPFSLGAIQKKLINSIPGLYVHSLKIGDSIIDDMENGYLMHPDKQIEMACELIQNDPQLANGYNAIGFSQGGQFLRGLVQRCPNPPMKNLISIGGQHQGIYGLPNCATVAATVCDYIRKILNYAAYEEWVQNGLAQATYWHDPLNPVKYKNGSTFLADINNEKEINNDYIKNLQSLEHFVLMKFVDDTVVQPVETEWFGFYKPGQSVETQSLEESDLYKNDRLGLKSMNEAGKLKFLSSPGNHLRFQWDWFVENVLEPRNLDRTELLEISPIFQINMTGCNPTLIMTTQLREIRNFYLRNSPKFFL